MRTQKRRRKARERARKLKAIGFKLLIVLLIILFLFGIFLVFRFAGLRHSFSNDEIAFFWKDEKLQIFWPEMKENSWCQISVYDDEKKSYVLIDELYVNEYVLEDVKEGIPLKILLQTMETKEDIFGKTRKVKGEKWDLDIVPVSVNAPSIVESADVETQKVTLTWNTDDTEYYEIYLLEDSGEWSYHTKTSEGWFLLDFIQNLSLPDRERPIQVRIRACYPQNDGVFYSEFSDTVMIERRELMPEYVDVHWEKTANSMYRIYWEESIGDLYEVQQWNYDRSVWERMDVVSWNDPLVYEIGRIPSSRNSRYRVITYDADTEAEKQLDVAEPGIVNFWSDLSPLYCTIWPIKELELYSDAVSDTVLEKVPAAQALCVLGEEEGRFRVMYGDTYGYIDSNFCLINLPEYLGDLCKYNITNSYSSIFRVHEYDIPYMTDEVIQGYEDIHLETDEYLVPFLYPCSEKLRVAAENCIADGYTLVIYDAFRPNEATRFMFDTAFQILDYPVPEIYEPENEEELEEPENSEEEIPEEKSPDEESSADETMDPTVSGNSIVQPDRYDDLIPEVLADLAVMTPEELAVFGLTPETVAAVSGCSAESLIYLKDMSYETLSMIQAGVFDLDDEIMWYTQQVLALQNAAIPEAQQAEIEGVSDNSITLPEELQIPVVRIDTSLMGISSDIKGAGVDGLPLIDYMIWQSLPADQLVSFKAYLETSVQTYYYVMTDNRYRLGSFLAEVTSTHNRGIALDLTIEENETGEEMPMQTSMHDLSWYSALPYNNENAELLAGYMLGAGFNDLSSEWWHFQDDDTRNTLGLNAFLTEGVSIEGWKMNDVGWYYQLSDGTYYKNTSVNIDGTTYTFNDEGYCER